MPRFFIDIEARFAQFQDSLDKITKNTQVSASNMEKAFSKVRSTILGIVGGVSIGVIGRELLKAAQDAEQASNRLQAVLRATGASASFAKGELDELAESIQEGLGFDDESVRNAQSALLKFGNVTGDVFRNGLRLAADLAAFMGTDIPEAAQIIGKSLQSPTEGLTLMERQFGKLTDAEEKHIKTLVQQGRAIEAQNAVLDLWRSKVGGVAEQMNTGLTKATRDVANAWDDMLGTLGRTETVGTVVNTVLKDTVGILRAIESLAKGPGPLGGLENSLALVNGELERLERNRPAKGRSPLIDERIEELKAERDRVDAILKAARSKESDIHAFDPTRVDVRLGGKAGNEAEVERERERIRKLAEKSVEDDLLAQQERLDERDALTRQHVARQREEATKAKKETLDSILKSADVEQERIEGLIFTWDKFGNRIEITREAFEELENQQKRNIEFANDLGFTFASAFEDAIVTGKKLSEVIKGLEQDIARIIIRKTVTEPFANAIAGAVGSAFGQTLTGKAGGGSVFGGHPYLVGEEGPELFVPGRSGAIVPNDALGSGATVFIDARGADAAAIARLESGLLALNASIEHRAVAAAVRNARRGGALAGAMS